MNQNQARRFLKRPLLWVMVLALCVAAPFVGYTSAWAQGNITPNADTFVDPNNPTGNYNAGQAGGGQLETTYTNFPSFSATRYSLLRFDLSSTTIDLSSSPLLLQIVSNNISADASVDLGIYSLLDDSWNEDTVTFNNAPTIGSLLQTITIAGGAANTPQVLFDDAAVTAYLEEQRTNDGVASFILKLTNLTTPPGVINLGGNLLFEDSEGSANGINGDEPQILTAGTITVIKSVTNDNGGTATAGDFTINVTGGNPSQSSFPGSDTGTTITVDAGSYSVTESTVASYTVSYSEDCTGTVAIGESKTCTVTNDDKPGTLTVIKSVTNDDGGTAAASAFTINVAGEGPSTGSFPGSATGTPVTLNAGAYTVTEVAATGYIGTYSADCTGTIALGENKTCTVTNDDQPATLVITKTVINNSGGSLTASAFTINVTGGGATPSSFAGSTTGTTVTLDAGSYSVSETLLDGYTPDYSAGCSGTIANGETKYCTVTNNDDAGTITVIKQVINDNGGTAVAGDFTINVSGNLPNPSSFAGSATGTIVAIDAGSYSVTETVAAGYAVTYSGECSGTIANGENKTCTVTNNDQPGTIVITKTVVNDNGGTAVASAFTLNVSAVSPSQASITGSSTGVSVTVNAGTYNITESAVTGYLPDYSAGCSGTIGVGETKYCTVTNDDQQATLTIIKQVTNNNGGTAVAGDFTLNISGSNPSQSSVTGSTTGTAITLDAGSYSVTETLVAGYVPTYGAECSGSVSVGQSKSCTVTNDDQPGTIVITKTVINDNGGTAVASDFTIYVNGTNPSPASFPGSASGVAATVDAGFYVIGEAPAPGYRASFSADCNDNTIAVGETRYCTITNDDQPSTLYLYKSVINDDAGTLNAADFPLSLNGTPVGSGDYNEVDAGTHTIDETQQAGYTLESVQCFVHADSFNETPVTAAGINGGPRFPELGEEIVPVANPGGGYDIDVPFGAFVECWFTNDDAPAPTVVTEATAGTTTGSVTTDPATGRELITMGRGNRSNITITAQVSCPSPSGGTPTNVRLDLNGTEYPMNETPAGSGIYVGTIPEDEVASGFVKVEVDCNGTTIPNTVAEIFLYDPSGIITNAITGAPVANATVTLYRVPGWMPGNNDAANMQCHTVDTRGSGGWTQPAPTNLGVMEDPNTLPQQIDPMTNPQTTGPDGRYGWDVAMGCWYVVVEATGYHPLTSPVVGVPPEVTDLNLALTPIETSGTLIVTKVVVNDDGGTKSVGDFALFANNTRVTSGVAAALPAGTYQLREEGSFGYRATFSGDCNAQGVVTVTTNTTKRCTITNNDIAPVVLGIANNVPATPGDTATVGLTYNGSGNGVNIATFSIDFDQTCLSFDPTDSDSDGTPDAVHLNLPAGFGVSVNYSAGDGDGELDFSLQDVVAPFMALPNGTILTIDFGVSNSAACQPAGGSTITAPVNFSADPTASFGTAGGSAIPATLTNGSVAIGSAGPQPADCNADDAVNAGDITALVLEIFDGDGNLASNASGGSFVGAPSCDANGDTVINAADISCTVLRIFGGTCSAATSAAQNSAGLHIAGGTVNLSNEAATVEIALEGNGNQIAAATFVVTYDSRHLTFDSTDSNGDGLPDAVSVPFGTDDKLVDIIAEEGRLAIVVAELTPSEAGFADGTLMAITFGVNSAVEAEIASSILAFSKDEAASLGNTGGANVTVTTQDAALTTAPIEVVSQLFLPVVIAGE